MTLHTYCRTIKEVKNDKMSFKGHKAAILTAFLSKTPKFGYNGDFQMKFWHLIPIGGGYKIWFRQSHGTHFGPNHWVQIGPKMGQNFENWFCTIFRVK